MIVNRKTILSCKGQALVETALVLPIILLLIFGIVEFGRIYNANIVISSASRDGARYASIGKTGAEVRQLIQSRTSSLDSSRLSISINPEDTRTHGNNVTVTVNYNIRLITPIVGPLISGTGSFHLQSSVSIRVE